jgi:hypothetical protein
MPAEIVLKQTPDAASLVDKREALAAVRALLAEREADLVQFRAQLKAFENRYFRQAGVLYADLDDLEARIAEREVDLYDSDSARQRAEESRRRAQETHDAAFGEDEEVEEFDPAPNLKTLFRDVAKRIHPDFARDAAEGAHFTLLMARANLAYRRGDLETLQRMLDDHREMDAIVGGARMGNDDAAELLRVARQIRHAQRDVAILDAERDALLASEIGQMYAEAEAVAGEGRDFLAELVAGLHEQIAEARRRFEFVDRQVTAHGR